MSRPRTEIDALRMGTQRGDGYYPKRLWRAIERLAAEGLMDTNDRGEASTNERGKAVLERA